MLTDNSIPTIVIVLSLPACQENRVCSVSTMGPSFLITKRAAPAPALLSGAGLAGNACVSTAAGLPPLLGSRLGTILAAPSQLLAAHSPTSWHNLGQGARLTAARLSPSTRPRFAYD